MATEPGHGARPDMDQEHLGKLFAEHDLQAIPVVDTDGRMQGIVTVDDIVDVLRDEATEDIQKIGGTEALEAPYLKVSFRSMLSKRVVWLAVLFVGEMLTATAMGRFEHEIARAVVLARLHPAHHLQRRQLRARRPRRWSIRAMALGEVTLRGLVARHAPRSLSRAWPSAAFSASSACRACSSWEALVPPVRGAHDEPWRSPSAVSVTGVVMFGTLSGSMLPFLLKRAGLDPASASAPFVATLVDVTGIVIYFTVASLMLEGTLL